MSISWDQWEAMRASLDYSWRRMRELADHGQPEGRAEYEALIPHALSTANRLLDIAGPCTPDLSSAKLRLRWQAGRNEAMAIRERIVEHQAEDVDHASFAPALASSAESEET